MNKKDVIDLIDSVIRKLERKTDLITAQGELKTVRYWVEKGYEPPSEPRRGISAMEERQHRYHSR